jgi:biotin synthase
MIGIGPYLCAPDTPFFQCVSGTALETKIVLALVRLSVPKALMPATTALRTLDGDVTVFDAGANVMMLNLTPERYRTMYQIYPNKDRAKDARPQDWTSTIDALKKHGRAMDCGPGDVADWKGVRP